MGYLDNIKRAPTNGGNSGNYMKLVQGENKFRILGSIEDGGFITGMLGWIEEDGKKTPVRWECESEQPMKFADKPKEFFAMKVYNYAQERVQVLEITQVKLKNDLTSYCEDEEWGDPRKYDISIVRNGEGMETTYAMVPKPHKKMSDEVRQAITDTSVNLKALYTGGDPFAENEKEPF